MRVEVIGGFRVEVDGTAVDEVDWPQRRPKALVKMLALTTGHKLHRERVLDALWPELDATVAGNNLRKALHLARAKLGADAIVSQGDLLSLPTGASVDLDELEEAASNARVTGDVDTYRAALALCTGEVLPEDRYEDWATARSAQVHEETLALGVELAALL